MRHLKVEITKSTAKQPFRVHEIAGNGKQTGPGENYHTRQGIRKVLLFRLKLYNGQKILVHDYSYKGKPVVKYWLYPDGSTLLTEL